MHKYTMMICKPNGDGPYAQLEQEFENPLHEGDMIELYLEANADADPHTFQIGELWHRAGERKGTLAFCDMRESEEQWDLLIEDVREYKKQQQKEDSMVEFVIVVGPPMSGKTLNKETIARVYGCDTIYDEGISKSQRLHARGRCLVLTNSIPEGLDDIKVVDVRYAQIRCGDKWATSYKARDEAEAAELLRRKYGKAEKTGPTRNTNVTLNELKQMVAFAEEHGESEFKTITMHVTPGCALDLIEVSVGGGERIRIDADPGCM